MRHKSFALLKSQVQKERTEPNKDTPRIRIPFLKKKKKEKIWFLIKDGLEDKSQLHYNDQITNHPDFSLSAR